MLIILLVIGHKQSVSFDKMEQNTCYQIMNQLVSQAELLPSQEFLHLFQEKYGLKEFKLIQMNSSYAAEIYHDVFIKFMKNYSPNSELHWGENELRLFMWILANYLQIKRISIDQLGRDHWEYFCSIFPNKQSILFQYQTISLFKEPTPAKKWSPEEDQIFGTLVRSKDGKYKWSELAKELYIGSDRQYFRTPKQCRERWLNHLDPNKSKEEWDLRQDFILICHVFNKGKKWAEISKLLKNRRNEHSIKNRFKSLITKQNKVHPDVKDENAIIELIYRKYDNHFSKLRVVNTINSSGSLKQVKEEDQMPTKSAISNRDLLSHEVFQVLRSKQPKDSIKIQQNDIPSQVSIQNTPQLGPLEREYPAVNSFLDVAIREEREKQIRADMFLVEDPFHYLKKFFKSKDSYLWEQ